MFEPECVDLVPTDLTPEDADEPVDESSGAARAVPLPMATNKPAATTAPAPRDAIFNPSIDLLRQRSNGQPEINVTLQPPRGDLMQQIYLAVHVAFGYADNSRKRVPVSASAWADVGSIDTVDNFSLLCRTE